jgi:hypothetical protein
MCSFNVANCESVALACRLLSFLFPYHYQLSSFAWTKRLRPTISLGFVHFFSHFLRSECDFACFRVSDYCRLQITHSTQTPKPSSRWLMHWVSASSISILYIVSKFNYIFISPISSNHHYF